MDPNNQTPQPKTEEDDVILLGVDKADSPKPLAEYTNIPADCQG